MRDEDVTFVRAHVPWAVIAKIEKGSHGFVLKQPNALKRRFEAFPASRELSEGRIAAAQALDEGDG